MKDIAEITLAITPITIASDLSDPVAPDGSLLKAPVIFITARKAPRAIRLYVIFSNPSL